MPARRRSLPHGLLFCGMQLQKYQDPGCYTDNLNHVVLLTGFLMLGTDDSRPHIFAPFWLIRNSWGSQWGDNGYMRMGIEAGSGVCGINVLPGIYPIVKRDSGYVSISPCHSPPAADDPCMLRASKYIVSHRRCSTRVIFRCIKSRLKLLLRPSLPAIPAADDPCMVRAYKYSSESSSVLNPCGSFQCTPDGTSNHCACTAPFKEVTNADGMRSCAYSECDNAGGGACMPCCAEALLVPLSSTRNPCEVGTCMDDGEGAYTCVCPPTHTPDTTIDGFPTCSKGARGMLCGFQLPLQ
ncbi:unnamed protein product [Closterium sp. NIES-65]|nr:unnamed protein product [Closterium sp. NIES-65]